jgi:hypothetical protein
MELTPERRSNYFINECTVEITGFNLMILYQHQTGVSQKHSKNAPVFVTVDLSVKNSVG